MILRARVVVPVSAEPIENGAIGVAGSRITFVGRWQDVPAAERGQVTDLGDVALLPGLINAHCHLDYTDLAGQLAPTPSFTDWIKGLAELKEDCGYSEYAQSWLNGARMLLTSGTTTVADIEAVPELLPEVHNATPLRVHSFLEMTGVKSRRAPAEILNEIVVRIDSLRSPRGSFGLSPHAPYSTVPELFQLSARVARERRWRVTTHLAESLPEFEMFSRRRGDLYQWLRLQRDVSDCGAGSPVQHAARNGLLGPNLLAVHVNYLADGDAELLAKRQTHVVHCPRSHAYFKHQRFPARELAVAGVNLCLGTDSLVSVLKKRGQRPRLSMFDEMRALTATEPELAPRDILRMATVNGAAALGLRGQIGVLTPGAFADLIAVPYAGKPEHVYEALTRFQGNVQASMIDGEWAI